MIKWGFLRNARSVFNILKSINVIHHQSVSQSFSSVAQSCLTLCDPMNHRTPSHPIHHQLPEFTQTHVHRVGDAVQPSHCSVVPFSSCPQPLPTSRSFPMSQLFTWGGQSIRVSASASVLPKNTQDWSPSEWTGWISLQSKVPANLENSAVATGLEKVHFHSNPKERQCQTMLKLPHNCTHLTC